MVEITVELVFFVVTFLISSSILLLQPESDFASTYQWVYSNRMLLSFLEQDYGNLSVLNIIRHLKCNEIESFDAGALFQDILNRTSKGYHYILYSPDSLHIYNLQESVCMGDLRINTFLFNSSCGKETMMFSVWDKKAREVC